MSASDTAGRPAGIDSLAYPLDRDDPRVERARSAERRAYEHYGIEFTEEFVSVPDLETSVRVLAVGSGAPVVLVPGGVGYGMIWAPLLPELDGYTRYVVDRPGGGLSDGIDHRSRPIRSIAATSMAAVVDHLGIDDAPFVGNSLGGLFSLRFAIAHPERVSGLSLLGCPAVYPGTSAPLPMRLGSLPGLGPLIVGTVMSPEDIEDARQTLDFLGHPTETVDVLPNEFVEAWYRMGDLPHFKRSWVSILRTVLRPRGADRAAAFTPGDLQSIRSPVSLIWGRDDPFGSLEDGRAGAEHFPEAAFHEVGVGHLPWLDEPERCGEIVGEFLADTA